EDFRLDATWKGILVATPLLGGSIFRVVMGGLTDHLGPRRTGLVGIALTFVPLLLGWLFADSLWRLLPVAVLLGVPGASFAVALPLVSRWYPPEHQGLAMGIAGAGNSGTVLAALFMPRLAAAFGWRAAMGLATVPMAVAAVVFFLCARDSSSQPAPRRFRDYAALLRELDTLWFCLFYGITFGGFVGLASFLGIFFHDQYGVGKVAAGDLTALCVFAGSFMRPIGGLLADRPPGALGRLRMGHDARAGGEQGLGAHLGGRRRAGAARAVGGPDRTPTDAARLPAAGRCPALNARRNRPRTGPRSFRGGRRPRRRRRQRVARPDRLDPRRARRCSRG